MESLDEADHGEVKTFPKPGWMTSGLEAESLDKLSQLEASVLSEPRFASGSGRGPSIRDTSLLQRLVRIRKPFVEYVLTAWNAYSPSIESRIPNERLPASVLLLMATLVVRRALYVR
jgi:hypothetical protein